MTSPIKGLETNMRVPETKTSPGEDWGLSISSSEALPRTEE